MSAGIAVFLLMKYMRRHALKKSAGIAVAVATNTTVSQSFIENITELSGMSEFWAKCFPCLVHTWRNAWAEVTPSSTTQVKVNPWVIN
jgi:hypothetical protein